MFIVVLVLCVHFLFGFYVRSSSFYFLFGFAGCSVRTLAQRLRGRLCRCAQPSPAFTVACFAVRSPGQPSPERGYCPASFLSLHFVLTFGASPGSWLQDSGTKYGIICKGPWDQFCAINVILCFLSTFGIMLGHCGVFFDKLGPFGVTCWSLGIPGGHGHFLGL